MRFYLSLVVLCLGAPSAWALKLSDYNPYIFEVLFTNPVCKTYYYDRPLMTQNGGTVLSRPKDVYCKHSDETASVSRTNSPRYRLTEWILDEETKELHLAYLSFRNKNIMNALCKAVSKGVRLSMILDHGEEKRPNKDAEKLKECGKSGHVSVNYRGNTGGLGYAHNKVMMVNSSEKVVKIVFSSGNMTSGTSTNHENWNFVTTSGESYFAQAHKCLFEAMIEAGDSKKNFTGFLNQCRGGIKAGPESDIEVFFVPVDGKEALKRITGAAEQAESVDVISHRLSGVVAKLLSDLLAAGKAMRLLLDDDIYWSAALKKDIGRNTRIEAFKIYNEIINKGANTRFLETNDKVFQLQHNKFLLFNSMGSGAVFNGAGNMTSAAFTKNFENFYFIQIPEVYEAYKQQYKKYFDEMATAKGDMPREYVNP